MEKLDLLVRTDTHLDPSAPEGVLPHGAPPATEPYVAQPPRLRARVVFGLGTAVGLFFVTEAFAECYADSPNMPMVDWMFTGASQLFRGWVWAAFTPLVFFLYRTIPRFSQARLVQVVMHLGAASVLLLVGNIARLWAAGVVCGYWDFATYTISNTLGILGAHTIVDFYLYGVVLGLAYVRDVIAKKRQTELRAEQLRTQLLFAELAALKQQVQPHFLFNSLNAISALMRDGDSRRALGSLSLLATLLRSLLSTAGQAEIELRRELDYSECYLAIEKVRFEERLRTAFEVEEECLEAWVPTLLLQPLIENAVKHGIARRLRPGTVRVNARRRGEWLVLQVANEVADRTDAGSPGECYGIGLRATRTRLEHLFGPNFRLDCRFDSEGWALVTIEIPFHLVPEATAA